MMGLVSWNVRYFSHRTKGITSTDKTMRQVANALTQIEPQPDIIALQEIDDRSIRSGGGRAGIRRRHGQPDSQFARFLDCINLFAEARGGFGYKAVFFPAHGHNKRLPLLSTGLAILYRNSLTCVANNGHQPCDITHRRIRRLARVKQTRICAWCRFETEDGVPFDVFNTHLSLPAFLKRVKGPTGGRFGEADNQIREVESLLDYVDQHGSPDTSIVLGDFNARPGSRVYNRVIKSGAFRDAHAAYLGANTSQMAGLPSAGFMAVRFRLDHVFSGDRVRFLSFDYTEPYGPKHPWRSLSDHSPLVGRFTVGDA
jgi:endonuclease/exonuclease/phosphatase family metal-dependent hydrolase